MRESWHTRASQVSGDHACGRQARMAREIVLSAKEEQARLEQRIADLEARLEGAQVVERTARGGAVEVGAHVRVRDSDTRKTEAYDVVGSGRGPARRGPDLAR